MAARGRKKRCGLITDMLRSIPENKEGLRTKRSKPKAKTAVRIVDICPVSRSIHQLIDAMMGTERQTGRFAFELLLNSQPHQARNREARIWLIESIMRLFGIEKDKNGASQMNKEGGFQMNLDMSHPKAC